MHKREKANSPNGGSRQTHTDIPLAGTRKEKNCHTGGLTEETAFSLNPSEARGTSKQQVPTLGRHTWAPLTQTWRSAPFTPSQHSGTCVCNRSLPVRFAGPASHVFRDLRGLASPACSWTEFLAEHKQGSKGQFSSLQAELWALGCRGEMLSTDFLGGRSFICVPLMSEKESSTVLSHCSPPASAGEPEGVAQSLLPRSHPHPHVLLSSLEGNAGRQTTHRCLAPPNGCHPRSPWLLHGAFLHKSHPEEQFFS